MKRIFSIMALLFLSFIHSSILYAFPVVTSLTPDHGPDAGGTVVQINGSNFTGVLAVKFGPNFASSVTFVSDSELMVTAPPGSIGNVNVIVTTPIGNSAAVPGSVFTYTGDWTLYVASGPGNAVSAIDTASFSSIATIPVAPSADPIGIAISPDAQTAYVVNLGSNTVTAINVATNTVVNTFSLPVGALQAFALAVTPDGTGLYVVSDGSNTITHFNIPSGTVQTAAIPSGGVGPSAIAISPDGTTAYVCNSGSNLVSRIDLSTDSLLTGSIAVGPNPSAIAITPNGQFVYVCNSNDTSVSVINTATHALVNTIPVGIHPSALAITPDGKSVYVTNPDSNSVSHINVATQTVVSTIFPTNPITTPEAVVISPDGIYAYIVSRQPIPNVTRILVSSNAFQTGSVVVGALGTPVGIAITPDQSPVAHFTATPGTGTAGLLESFNASTSISPVGTIASYQWNFGDGTTATTTLPTISHTYAASGSYTVTLQVTNSAGTSVTEPSSGAAQTFTGQTVSNNGGPLAMVSQILNTAPVPPSGLTGKKVTNTFLTQVDNTNVITFTPSPDPTVAGYFIFRNGVLVATIPPGGPFVYVDHNMCPGVVNTYSLVAFTASGIQGVPLTITL